MATRSRIGIQNADGTITSIYCHYDGYMGHNGKMLLNHYAEEAKVRELISLGDMSSLHEKVSPTSEHSFDNPEEGVCVFYGRDRREKDVEARTSENIREFLKIGEEYNYLYRGGMWYKVKQDRSGRVRYTRLTERNTASKRLFF